MQKISLTEQLVAGLEQRREELYSDSVQALSRYYLLDWLGSAIGGMATETGKAFLNYGQPLASGSSTVLGLDDGRSTEVAALINGALSHIVEMDDVDRVSIIHPAAVIIPAALAVADEMGASAEQLLAAIAAGYEVAIRIGGAVGSQHYFHFHNTSTCGVFGAAMAAAWLYRLDQQQSVWALGNAGTQAAGLWEFNTEGAQSKPLHTGRAAANGVLAAILSRAGISGARRILEGERGFFAGLAPSGEASIVVERLDGPLKIAEVSIKPHASCRHTHAPIDATLQLRERLLSKSPNEELNNILSVQVAVYKAAQVLCDKADPQTVADAKFSLQYCIATALLRGEVGLSQFGPDHLWAFDIRQLMDKIVISVDDTHESRYPECWSAAVTVTTYQSDTYTIEIANPKGDPENPLSQNELETKFRLLAEYGLTQESVSADTDRLLDWVTALAGTSPVDTSLLAALYPHASRV